MAAVMLQELRARHIKVPEQVKLASFYDSELLISSTPQISAAQFDGERLAPRHAGCCWIFWQASKSHCARCRDIR